MHHVQESQGQTFAAPAAAAPDHQDATTTWQRDADPDLSPHLRYNGNGGIEEIDTTEDSIDGMGAMKFTDEEDWGYFGGFGDRPSPL